jgi:membrane associated rhomboid family serine protease
VIPLRAENPRRTWAVVNILLILLNTAVFVYQVSLPPKAGEALVNTFGVVPARAERAVVQPTRRRAGPVRAVKPNLELTAVSLITSMFLHGGILHLLGNMLFLWVFGSSVEDRLGHLSYLLFYFLCGLGAGITHIVANWGSTLPSIGASGAISGVMGAYIVLFPFSRILTLVPLLFFFFTFRIPALLMLGYWFGIQFLSGLSTLGEANQGGVAWWAHIGGFLMGAVLVLLIPHDG